MQMILHDSYDKWFVEMKAIYERFFEGNESLNNLMEKNTLMGS